MLLGLTQEDFAEMMNISSSFAGQIERGESVPSVETLQLIIQELNIDPRLIFLDEPQRDASINSPEFADLCLLMRRMSKQQKKLVFDFVKLICCYKIT